MKKKLLVGGLSLAVIGISSLAFISKPTYQEVSMNDLENEKVALYIKNDTGNYEKTNTIPTSGYILNEEKSRCNNNAKPSWNKATNSLKIKDLSNDNTSCYLYFDVYQPTASETILANVTINTDIPDFTSTATTDEGVYAVNDGMYSGTSYYFRGAVTNNYLKFANFCWRIVRINGDGSIRLIYDGTTCHANGTGEVAIASQKYNINFDKSEYVGYTYTAGSQRGNSSASNLKTQTESWYENNVIKKGYDGKVATGKFCNDRNTASDSTWDSQPTSDFYYATYERLVSTKLPTLSCSNSSDVYSLKVGAITADEVVFAGGSNANNSLYYLYNGQRYWTMSPYNWHYSSIASNSYAAVFYVTSNGMLLWDYVGSTNYSFNVRPVINLKADTLFTDGNGTLDNPYVVEGA